MLSRVITGGTVKRMLGAFKNFEYQLYFMKMLQKLQLRN